MPVRSDSPRRDLRLAYDIEAHRCHDFTHLAARWSRLAARLSLPLREIARHDGEPILMFERPVSAGGLLVYISAGIHGDEPASTEGLILWAEHRLAARCDVGFVIFPCLNPWGLVNNRREDASGNDLNRGWQRHGGPVAQAVREAVARRRFDLALTLHEDFDGRGVYLYEPIARRPHWGERLLAALPMTPDPRRRIDGSLAKGGIIRRRVDRGTMPELPEAIVLHLEHARRTFTLETPSEFSLVDRVACQIAFIDAALDLAAATPAAIRAGNPRRPVRN